jgi:DNA invertase Pin-like site-specific DNA recombinase
MRAAVYMRVSTDDQTVENQRLALRRHASARGWTVAREYADAGISGARASRPALDRMLKDAAAGRFDVVMVAKLDRLGRSVRHLHDVAAVLQTRGVALVSVGDGFDLSTANGRLLFNVLASIAEFERELIAERTRAGHARARSEGKRIGGRKRIDADFGAVRALSLRKAAAALGVSMSTIRRARMSP